MKLMIDWDDSDDAYKSLKRSLLDRVNDKESTVRMQAVVALSKLQDADAAGESDDDDSEDEDEEEILGVAELLIDVLSHDPAPFVFYCVSVAFKFKN